ncbi:MAG: hypothetical protein LBI68_00175, partial [Azoarcus sp.]|nr:hypothetical protein [Azoarcus sp.]
MSTTRFLLCCVLLAATEVASADLGMLKRTCGACHAPAEDTGKAPSFKAIAARYKNANGAEPQLLTA